MSPRPKNPPPDRRAEILDAALRLFAEKGYAEAANAEIAKEAGVTAAALYYYFPSKEELFRAAVSEHLAQFLPTLTNLTRQGGPPDGGSQEPFRSLLQRALAFFTGEKSQLVLKIILAEGPRRPEIRQIWNEQTAAAFASLMPYLAGAIADGRIRPVDPRLVFVLLQGPLMLSIVLRDLLQVPALQELTDEALMDAVLEVTLPGLLTDGR